jgi:subtilisin family serine protease
VRIGRKAAIAGAVAASLTLVTSSALAKSPPKDPTAGAGLFGQEVVPGEVIVRFEQDASGSDQAGTLEAADASFKRELLLPRTELVKVREGAEEAAAARLERDPNVVYAEPNGIGQTEVTPNDTRFTDLWGMNNTGQPVNAVAGLADADIDAPEAWNMGKGLGSVRVAVIDSGVARTHPDLTANMFTNPGESGGGKETNGIDDDGNGKVDDFRGWDFVNNDNNPADDNGHGTHVAGTVAASSNNSLGVSGAASFPTTSGNWAGPRILAVKVADAAGSVSIATLADGIVYAGAMNAKVANISIGFAGTSTTLDNAIKSKPNTLYAVSAGNNGTNNDTTPRTPCVPASTPDAANKICVAATDSGDALASFSNFGATNVDLAAPGVNILSTIPTRTVFSDNFETAITGRWTTNDPGQTGTPRWGRTTLFSTSPSNSLTDSPGGTAGAPAQYVNNQDNWARNSTGFNLTGGQNCKVTAQAKLDTESGFDFFTVEATRTPTVSSSWQEIFRFSGGPATGRVTADIPAAFNNQTNVFIRFRLDADGSIVDDGAYVDDVAVGCFTSTFNATSYAFLDGTSMATPHVAGAATFLFTKFPTATVAQVKDKLLRSVDTKAGLSGDVATGGRLNLYKAAAESTAAVSGGVLRFTAGTGQTNQVTVTRFTDTDGVAKYRITDPYSTSTTAPQAGSRINPGAGCARVNDTTVKCPVAGITRIILAGADLNDALNASTIAIPVTLNGDSGLDSLTGGTAGDSLVGGTGADGFRGGRGNDTISARNNDVDNTFSCGENAGDNDTVNADLSPNDPITASATNCEVVNKN